MILTNRMIKFILWPLMASALVSSQMAPKYKEESIESKEVSKEEPTKSWSKEESKEKSKEEIGGWEEKTTAEPTKSWEKTTAERHGYFS